MDIKKVKAVLMCGIVLGFGIPLLILCAWGWGDDSEYKRIGDTNFYLLESDLLSPGEPRLFYSNNLSEHGFTSISHGGFPLQIFWNDRFLVAKCSDKDEKRIINYCIIEYFHKNSFDPENDYVLHEYSTKKEYEKAMARFGLKESEMQKTDNHIPWSLHLFD